MFNEGRYDPESRNRQIFETYHGKTLSVDLKIGRIGGVFMPQYAPFFFQDLDFDDKPELVIVNLGMGVRYHNTYDVYHIVGNTPVLMDYAPYHNMTDYPEFDFKHKTILCPYPEGELNSDGKVIYGVSKKKYKMIVHGKAYYFNKIIKIKDIKYRKGEY